MTFVGRRLARLAAGRVHANWIGVERFFISNAVPLGPATSTVRTGVASVTVLLWGLDVQRITAAEVPPRPAGIPIITSSVSTRADSFADRGCAMKRNSSVWTVRVSLLPALRVARRRRLFFRSAGESAVSCVAISCNCSEEGVGPSRRAVRDCVMLFAGGLD